MTSRRWLLTIYWDSSNRKLLNWLECIYDWIKSTFLVMCLQMTSVGNRLYIKKSNGIEVRESETGRTMTLKAEPMMNIDTIFYWETCCDEWLEQEMEIEPAVEPAELHMVTISLKVTKMDKIRNEYIRRTARVDQTGIKFGREGWGTWVEEVEGIYWATEAECGVAKVAGCQG